MGFEWRVCSCVLPQTEAGDGLWMACGSREACPCACGAAVGQGLVGMPRWVCNTHGLRVSPHTHACLSWSAEGAQRHRLCVRWAGERATRVCLATGTTRVKTHVADLPFRDHRPSLHHADRCVEEPGSADVNTLAAGWRLCVRCRSPAVTIDTDPAPR